MKNIFFNAQHSPIGAFASFTLGYKGAKGGLGLELGGPADQNVYIGLESENGDYYEALPFFEPSEDESKRYDVERGIKEDECRFKVKPFDINGIDRHFDIATDTWRAGDLTFKIFSPAHSMPDPETASEHEVKMAFIPAVFVEMTVDNTKLKRSRRAFFGFKGNDPYSGMRLIDDKKTGGLAGVAEGFNRAIVGLSPDVKPAIDFLFEDTLKCSFEKEWTFCLGKCGNLIMDVPAGEKVTYRFAVCFYKGGIVTTGLDTSYYYTKYFKNIEEVACFALEKFEDFTNACEKGNELTKGKNLSDAQKFMLAQAIRGYYGSTQLLDNGGKPFWVVNEGEYRMMNTLDLTVDMMFYEMRMNPWTLRNVLDVYLDRYSYYDTVYYQGKQEEYPGGISFAHDMGVMNNITRPGCSSYEMYGKKGCFSYMTHEQLVNWCCCALVYVAKTGDKEWLNHNLGVLTECFKSMLNRDDTEPEKRDGIMSLDSTRTMGGAEITTYDSLDVSLGQARNNIYLAGKCWALYVAFEKLFSDHGMGNLAEEAGLQAEKCADTVASHMTEEGYIPAVLGEGVYSKIIPAVEGLIFPYFMNCKEALDINGRFSKYINALKRHVENILVPGVCIFENGGWKLSSTSNNSFPSKICLCEFIIRHILKIDLGEKAKIAHEVHAQWLLRPENAYWCFSDQIISGIALGSKYYPRGVTAILWLENVEGL
jgi:hypothetical protein